MSALILSLVVVVGAVGANRSPGPKRGNQERIDACAILTADVVATFPEGSDS